MTDEAAWDATLAEDEERPKRSIVLIAANGMRLRAPKWLYDRRMPTDAITLLAGREGIGKSTIAFDIVARVTRGTLPGRFEGAPRNVGIIASEDSWESVILPRLIAARADLARVFRVEARTEAGTLDTVSAPADLAMLATEVEEHDLALIVLDPVMSVIHGSLDTHKDREVRQALDPLARFCAEREVAVLGLIHVNKSGTTDPLNSIMASKAFTAVARSVLYCIVDPDSDGEDRYLFCHAKSNLGPKQPSHGYRIIEVKLEIDGAEDPRDAVIVTSKVGWLGEDQRMIRELMEGRPVERPTGDLAHRIVDWLTKRGSMASIADIAADHPDVKRNTLAQNLKRLVDRGTILRSAYGLYGLPKDDTQNDSALETSLVSSLSLPSSETVRMTRMTAMTPSQVSLPLSSADCTACGWPVDSNGHEANCQEAA